MRIPKGIARIPLWKRDIPRYPLYYKGDPSPKIVLPLFWMKLIPPERKIPPHYVHFQVHPQMSKLDIKQYLEKIYDVPVLNVRTELRKRDVMAFSSKVSTQGILGENREKRHTEEDKYAYVQLRGTTFKYPGYFEEGGQTATQYEQEMAAEEKKRWRAENSKQQVNQGLPPWFLR
ncbi:54S ribosomal protein L23 [Mactra antiquata]